ncbi:MAG: hypothetical protein M3P51_08570 [Chloroflexota bacterium]|nr:hypothetical protein [Chloroflexota bacterium]
MVLRVWAWGERGNPEGVERLAEADWRGLERRRGTERKTVRLTPEFRERVQAWADE